MENQHINSADSTPRTWELERAPFRKTIQAIKDEVAIEQVAAEYGEFKLLGNGRLLGRCVSPLHEDRTPSMTVFTDTQRFKCFGIGCSISGDVLDLEEYAGKHADTWTAVIALSQRYGIELPRRSRRWHERQTEKHEDREKIARVLAESYRRRLHRVFAPVILDGIEDPKERLEESARIWEGFGPVARCMALRRLGGGS